jgi:hypothetical protein
MGRDHVLDLPARPRGEAGVPGFQAPLEAPAMAMALRLDEMGHFTWAEWLAARATLQGQSIELHRNRGTRS